MANLFNNLDELKELIKQGKSNEEIINSRIKYLVSDDYKNNQEKLVDNEGAIIFYNGFIDSGMSDSVRTEATYELQNTPAIKYKMTNNDCYNDIINIIRENTDMTLGNLLNVIYDYVINYFSKSTKESNEFIEELKNFRYNLSLEILNDFKNNKENYNGREQIYNTLLDIYETNVISAKKKLEKFESKRILLGKYYQRYYSVDYDGDFIEFCKANYIYENKDNNVIKNNEEYLRLLKKYTESLKTKRNNISIDISEIAGYGIGACVERSLLAQNLLIFCGIDSYKMDGMLNNNEIHAFNVIATSTEPKTYYMFDTAQLCKQKINNINSIDDLKQIKNLKLINQRGTEISYSSFDYYNENKKAESIKV